MRWAMHKHTQRMYTTHSQYLSLSALTPAELQGALVFDSARNATAPPCMCLVGCCVVCLSQNAARSRQHSGMFKRGHVWEKFDTELGAASLWRVVSAAISTPRRREPKPARLQRLREVAPLQGLTLNRVVKRRAARAEVAKERACVGCAARTEMRTPTVAFALVRCQPLGTSVRPLSRMPRRRRYLVRPTAPPTAEAEATTA
jgi:hypothetical protein